MVRLPRPDGLVQRQIRPNRKVCRLHDPLELRALRGSLSCGCKHRLYDEVVHPAAAGSDVCDSDDCRVYPLSAALRDSAPHPVCPLVRVRREEAVESPGVLLVGY